MYLRKLLHPQLDAAAALSANVGEWWSVHSNRHEVCKIVVWRDRDNFAREMIRWFGPDVYNVPMWWWEPSNGTPSELSYVDQLAITFNDGYADLTLIEFLEKTYNFYILGQ